MAEPTTDAGAPEASGSGIAGRSVAALGAASAFSAVSLYLVILIAARTLSPTDNTLLLTWIAAYQLGTGLLTGLTTELTRSVAARRSTGPAVTAEIRVGRLAAIAGGTAALLAPALWFGWGEGLRATGPALVGVVAVGMGGFAVHAALSGSLAGLGRWSGVARLTFAEAGVKLAIAGVALALGASLLTLCLAIAAGAFAWTLLFATGDARPGFRASTDRTLPALTSRIGSAVASQGASAVLTVGFPLLLALSSPAPEFAHGAGLLLAISLTRAPLMIPLVAFQTMVVAWFMHSDARRGRTFLLLTAGMVAVGVVGAGLAWAIGPWIMEVAFTYDVPGIVLGWLTFAAALLALLTLVGALCQADDLHPWFLGGWLTALVVAIACLALPGTLEMRAIVALLVGPTTGIAAMAAGLLRRRRP